MLLFFSSNICLGKMFFFIFYSLFIFLVSYFSIEGNFSFVLFFKNMVILVYLVVFFTFGGFFWVVCPLFSFFNYLGFTFMFNMKGNWLELLFMCNSLFILFSSVVLIFL